MTTVELRTSIVSDINLMNAEMLESVSRYIKRLTSHRRNLATHSTDRHETAMQFMKNLSAKGGNPVPTDERGIEALLGEKYDK
jgi:hypothetical protein